MTISAKIIFLERIQQRFGANENISLIAISTIVDSIIKNLHFKDVEACINALNFIRRSIIGHIQNISLKSDTWHTNPGEQKAEVMNFLIFLKTQ